MFILGNLIIAIATLLRIAVTVAYWLLIIRVVLSWVPVNKEHQLVVLLYNLTDPVLEYLHRIVPSLRTYSSSIGFDFMPIIAFFALFFVDRFLIESLFDLGHMLAP